MGRKLNPQQIGTGVVPSTSVMTLNSDNISIVNDPTNANDVVRLGFLGNQAQNDNINNTDWLGEDLTIENGGTGSSTAADARIALGLQIGVDIQGYNENLADLAILIPTDNSFLVGNGSNFVAKSGAAVRVSMGLGSIATQEDSNVTVTGGNISGTTITVATPTLDGHAANKAYVDTRIAGLDIRPDVLALIADASTTEPPTNGTGDRYILVSNTNSLHGNWGTIAGVGDGDIVQYDGSDWVVSYDASVEEGALVWDRTINRWFSHGESIWTEFGGLAGVTAGTGLTKSGDTINVGEGNGIIVNADTIEVAIDTTGGTNLAPSISVSSNGVAIKIDDGTLSFNDSNQLIIKDLGVNSGQLADDAVNIDKIDWGNGASQVDTASIPVSATYEGNATDLAGALSELVIISELLVFDANDITNGYKDFSNIEITKTATATATVVEGVEQLNHETTYLGGSGIAGDFQMSSVVPNRVYIRNASYEAGAEIISNLTESIIEGDKIVFRG